MSFNVEAIRRQFPFLNTTSGKSPVYLDNAATTQTPQVVIDAMQAFYSGLHGNPHRGLHAAADSATVAYEAARQTVQTFIYAKHPDEIIFTRNATEGINLIAKTWGRANLKKGDRIILTILE